MSEEKPSCFIIMPISTPDSCHKQYKDDSEHFQHVQDHLFIPAIKKAGHEPLLPKSTGSEIIHAEIIEKLTKSAMVLCDMSILNANVFFELGVRTSLNKPVALIVDDKTPKIPFDLSNVNRHEYKSALNAWELESEIDLLAQHIDESYKKSQNENALWKIFKILDTAEFSTDDVTTDDKFNLLYRKMESLESIIDEKSKTKKRGLSFQVTDEHIKYLNMTPVQQHEFEEKRFMKSSDIYIDPIIEDLSLQKMLNHESLEDDVETVFDAFIRAYSHVLNVIPTQFVLERIESKLINQFGLPPE